MSDMKITINGIEYVRADSVNPSTPGTRAGVVVADERLVEGYIRAHAPARSGRRLLRKVTRQLPDDIGSLSLVAGDGNDRGR